MIWLIAARRAVCFEQELPGIGQELTEIFFLFDSNIFFV